MYTVIVADDEQEIRRSLIWEVDWGRVGFRVIGVPTACTGVMVKYWASYLWN